jgi:hypothetical protein
VRHVNQRFLLFQLLAGSQEQCQTMQHAPAWMRTTSHAKPDRQAVRLHDLTTAVAWSSAGRLLLMSPADCLSGCMQLPAFLPV